MTMLMGTNGPVIAEWEDVFVSPDPMSVQAQVFNAALVQRHLTVNHVAGDGIFILDDITAFIGEHVPMNDLRSGVGRAKPLSGGTQFTFNWYGFGGQNWIGITQITNGTTDQNCPIGSMIENQRSNWDNPNHLDIYPPILNGGINTGVPAGIRTNQKAKVIMNPNVSFPTGNWTMQAYEGTGSLQFLHVNTGYNQTVNFVNGVATNSDQIAISNTHLTGTWNVILTASDDTNPLNRFRFVCPGTASNGQTYVQNYIDNKNDTTYFQYHEQFIRMHRNNRTNGIVSVRQMNAQGINRMPNPLPVKESTDLTPAMHCFGNKRPQEIPFEWIADMSKAANVDLTWGINYRFSNAGVLWTANMLDQKLASGRKTRVSYSNENWNDQYAHIQWMAWQEINRINGCTITRSGTTATVTKTAHGLTAGVDTVIISGAQQDAYNGEFLVATTPTADTFTYSVSGSPAISATAYTDSAILAYKLDSSLVKDVISIVMDVSNASTRWVMTLPSGHDLVTGDMVSMSGFQDPKLNAVYRITSTTGTTANMVWIPGGMREPIATLPGMNQAVPLRSGATLRYRRVLRNAITTQDGIGIPSLKYAVPRYVGRRLVEIHNIMRPVLGSRLVEVIEGFAPGGYNAGDYNRIVLDSYQAANGGTFPAATEFATAPYFQQTGLPDATLDAMAVGGATQAEIVTTILDSCATHIAGACQTNMTNQFNACTSRGIRATFYECGQHMLYLSSPQNATVSAAFYAANRDPRIQTLMTDYLNRANATGIYLAHYYLICGEWSSSGYWGAMENQAQQDSPPPKYQALLDYLGASVDPPTGSIMMYSLPGGLIVAYRI